MYNHGRAKENMNGRMKKKLKRTKKVVITKQIDERYINLYIKNNELKKI